MVNFSCQSLFVLHHQVVFSFSANCRAGSGGQISHLYFVCWDDEEVLSRSSVMERSDSPYLGKFERIDLSPLGLGFCCWAASEESKWWPIIDFSSNASLSPSTIESAASLQYQVLIHSTMIVFLASCLSPVYALLVKILSKSFRSIQIFNDISLRFRSSLRNEVSLHDPMHRFATSFDPRSDAFVETW